MAHVANHCGSLTANRSLVGKIPPIRVHPHNTEKHKQGSDREREREGETERQRVLRENEQNIEKSRVKRKK